MQMNDITKISSRDNAKLVMARKVRDGKISDLIFIEGLRLAEETLRSDLSVSDCFVTSAFGDSERGGELLAVFTYVKLFVVLAYRARDGGQPGVLDAEEMERILIQVTRRSRWSRAEKIW